MQLRVFYVPWVHPELCAGIPLQVAEVQVAWQRIARVLQSDEIQPIRQLDLDSGLPEKKSTEGTSNCAEFDNLTISWWEDKTPKNDEPDDPRLLLSSRL